MKTMAPRQGRREIPAHLDARIPCTTNRTLDLSRNTPGKPHAELAESEDTDGFFREGVGNRSQESSTSWSRPVMTYRKLGEYVAAEPFRPFRIRMASGQSFDIRHPERILVGRTSARIHTASGSETSEKWHDAFMLLMETVEPLDAPVHQANG
jgi:hypothetical protein